MTKNEIKNFMDKFATHVEYELENESNSETLSRFWKQFILSLTELDESWFEYIGSEEMMNELELYKEMIIKENEIKEKFTEEVVSFLNEWDAVDDGSNTIIFYPTDDLKNWDVKDSMRMVGELVQTGIFWHIGTKDNGFYMTRENYELLKKAAKIYDII